MATLLILNPDGTPALFGDHVDKQVIGPKRVHLMAGRDVDEPAIRLYVRSEDAAEWSLDCVVVRGIGFRLAEPGGRLHVMGCAMIPLPRIAAGKGLVLDVTIGLPENPSFGTVDFGVDASYVESYVIGPANAPT